MDNSAIADNFSLLSKLIDIHGEDSFKAKSYGASAFTIDKLPVQLATMNEDDIMKLKGIGLATGKKIIEQLHSGRLQVLDDYIKKTPAGVLELLNIKGLGPKKIATLWKELGVESVGELLYACEENRLLLYKGFGEKTQNNIKDSIQFYLSNQGSYLYAQLEEFAISLTAKLREHFPTNIFEITGDFNRQMEVITQLEWVTDTVINSLADFFTAHHYSTTISEQILTVTGGENVTLQFYCTITNNLYKHLFEKNCSAQFLEAWQQQFGNTTTAETHSEKQIFAMHHLPFIPVCYREKKRALQEAIENNLPTLISTNDIKGIIHSHSNWSDGAETIETMAKTAKAKGLEYLVISDHSQTAVYANGLTTDRIKAQHELIDELNLKLHPFKIFKSIESDILNDGKLDYSDEILASFDMVIASIHSNLKMSEEKAMMRLLNAINNPYTTILGHMTGRLLLSRNGYPVNYTDIIEACLKQKVVLELNAHSRRLDIDWRFIQDATDAGVLISINPDAHYLTGFDDIRYGVLVAQKAGVNAKSNFSSFSLQQMETYLQMKRNLRMQLKG